MAEAALTRTWEYVDKWAAHTPDKEAIVFKDRRMTWAGVGAEMNALAKGFIEAGVQQGDRVAMLAMACPEFLTSFMAANKVGASWLGMSPKFRAPELRYMIDDCQPKVLITLRSYMDHDLSTLLGELDLVNSSIETVLVIGDPPPNTESYADFIAQPRPDLDDALAQRANDVEPDDVALLMYTSGSTGKPKGVEHTHRSIIANIAAECRFFDVDSDMRALLHFPINHVAADVEIGFAAVYAGATVVMMDHFDPVASLEIIEKERITLFGQVPAMFLMQMGQPKFRDTDFSSVKAFVWSGAAAPKEMLQVLAGIAQKTGARLVTGYGSTEVCGFVTYSSPDDDLDTLSRTAGQCAEEFELRIVDEAGKPVPAGETGEVCIRGELLMKGYWNKPDLTAQVLDAEGWYHSGDLGHLDEHGNLVLSGRKSEMFKTGGENVFPREIEEVLESHPAVLFAAVIGVPHPTFQEVGKAYVMTKPGAGVTPEDLESACRANLANFKVPKSFEVRPLLPLLPNGKVNKMALRAELEGAGG